MKIAGLPVSEALCERFTVTLNGQDAPVAAARVSAMNFNCGWPGHQRPLDQTEIAGFVRCESDGPVEVCAIVKEQISEVCVRPLSKKIAVDLKDGEMRFTLPGPGQYVLEPNDHHCALHLFVSPEVGLPAVVEQALQMDYQEEVSVQEDQETADVACIMDLEISSLR